MRCATERMLKAPFPETWMLCGSKLWESPVNTSVLLPAATDAFALRSTCAPLRKTLAAEMVLATGFSPSAKTEEASKAINGSTMRRLVFMGRKLREFNRLVRVLMWLYTYVPRRFDQKLCVIGRHQLMS